MITHGTRDLIGAYSNTKAQVRAQEELREKLPNLDTPEPPSIKRDRPRRARQLGSDQVEQLVRKRSEWVGVRAVTIRGRLRRAGP